MKDWDDLQTMLALGRAGKEGAATILGVDDRAANTETVG